MWHSKQLSTLIWTTSIRLSMATMPSGLTEMVPTLLMRKSKPWPASLSLTCSTAVAMLLLSVTAMWRMTRRPPNSSANFWRASLGELRMAAKTIETCSAGSWLSSRTNSRPRPRPAPVTNYEDIMCGQYVDMLKWLDLGGDERSQVVRHVDSAVYPWVLTGKLYTGMSRVRLLARSYMVVFSLFR